MSEQPVLVTEGRIQTMEDRVEALHAEAQRVRVLVLAMIAECDALRETVRVLGEEYAKMRYECDHGSFSNGVTANNDMDEGDVLHARFMEESRAAVNANPGARAAVEGTT